MYVKGIYQSHLLSRCAVARARARGHYCYLSNMRRLIRKKKPDRSSGLFFIDFDRMSGPECSLDSRHRPKGTERVDKGGEIGGEVNAMHGNHRNWKGNKGVPRVHLYRITGVA